MRSLACCLVLVACLAAWAKQKPAHYSLCVEQASIISKAKYDHPVYVWLWVKSPGIYPFKDGITVADLVKSAGGLIKAARYPNLPSEYFPRTVSVMRSSAEDPDPTTSIYRFPLDWTKPAGKISESRFELRERDFVGVSMSTSVP
jgi:protein involved in polysaccharide export with SLBB domain